MVRIYRNQLYYLFIISTLFISSRLFTPSQSLAYDFFNWWRGVPGYEVARMDAEEFGRPLVLFFYKGSDEFSQKFISDYLSVRDVDELLLDVEKVELDANRGQDEEALAAEFKVEQYPCLYILLPSFSNEPKQVSPFLEDNNNMTSDDFIKSIKTVIIYLYNTWAFEFFEKKDYDNALKYFNIAKDWDEDRAYSYYALGVVYHTLGFEKNDLEYIEEAEKYFLKALEKDPDHAETKEAIEILKKDKEKY